MTSGTKVEPRMNEERQHPSGERSPTEAAEEPGLTRVRGSE